MPHFSVHFLVSVSRVCEIEAESAKEAHRLAEAGDESGDWQDMELSQEFDFTEAQ